MAHSSRGQAWRRAQRDRVLANRRDRRLQPQTWAPLVTQPGRFSKTKGQVDRGQSDPKPEKKWRNLWRRADKLALARHLKLPYPRTVWQFELDDLNAP
jgi:hypothetical protein